MTHNNLKKKVMHAFSSVIILRIYKYYNKVIFTNINILNNIIHIYLCGKLNCVYALNSGTWPSGYDVGHLDLVDATVSGML